MPIYAYRCTACDHAFDRLQKMSDPDPENCPVCAAAAVKRQLTAPSFRLSGSGWYETDFKKDGDRKRNLTEGGEAAAKAESGADSAGKGEKKADDKGSATSNTDAAASKPKADSPSIKTTPAAKSGAAGS